MKVIKLDSKEEYENAKYVWYALNAAQSETYGWLADESGLNDVIARLDRALSAYINKHPEEE